MTRLLRKLRLWMNVYRRIRFFRKMYPLANIVRDIFLFPLDYFSPSRPIHNVRNLTVAITHKCNLRCSMCYFHRELENRKELPIDIFRRVIDAVKSAHPCVILTGGEPCLHPNLLEMVKYVKDRKLPVQIFTNGVLLTKDLADALVQAGLDYIDVTLLGNETSHSAVAGQPDAYEKMSLNLAYLATHRGKTKVLINYTITPESVQDIEHAVTLARDLCLDGLRIQHYNFLLPAEVKAQNAFMEKAFESSPTIHDVESCRDVSSLGTFLIDFRERLPQLMPHIPVQWAPTLSNDEIRNWYSAEPFVTSRKCLYPWRGITLDADGKIYPCSKIYLGLGNVAEEDVFEAWNSSYMKAFRKHIKRNLLPACSRCCKL